ncbi:transposase [Rhodobacter sp. NSM]|uniref:transposase n=1 Tax=Rhodobacter sp. NSM TaxID=3457501 RepID=UPI003FD2D1DD
MLLAAQGWRDHDDGDALRHDPEFRLATSSAAGLTPLNGPGLASQPTLLRFTALMAKPGNLKILREAALELAGRGIRAERKGKRMRSVTLDIDSAPIEGHGHQPKVEGNGLCCTKPLKTGLPLSPGTLIPRPWSRLCRAR